MLWTRVSAPSGERAAALLLPQPASSRASGPHICKQFAGALRRCFPPAAWQPDAAQKLTGSLEALLSPSPALLSLILPGQAPANMPERGGQSRVGAWQDPLEGSCWGAGPSRGNPWLELTLGVH